MRSQQIPVVLFIGALIAASAFGLCAIWPREQGSSPVRAATSVNHDNSYSDLERKLRPLADDLPAPRPGDWLAEHREPGQTFAEYVDSQPVRRSGKLHTIYLCLVGDFTEPQQRVLNLILSQSSCCAFAVHSAPLLTRQAISWECGTVPLTPA
jgi:hypothetical protein